MGHEEYESLIETLNILADSDTWPLSPKPRLTSLPETSFPSIDQIVPKLTAREKDLDGLPPALSQKAR